MSDDEAAEHRVKGSFIETYPVGIPEKDSKSFRCSCGARFSSRAPAYEHLQDAIRSPQLVTADHVPRRGSV